MIDTNTAILILIALVLVVFASLLRRSMKKAKNLTKFQTFSKLTNGSLIESGIFTEHGIVYNPETRSITAQHKRSNFYYESVL